MDGAPAFSVRAFERREIDDNVVHVEDVKRECAL